MSSFLSAEDFNAIMSEPVEAQKPDKTVASGACNETTKPAFTIPQAELLEYGTVLDSTVPHQSQVEPAQCQVKPVKRVTEVHDPKAKPTCGLNLRLNDYQIELIRSMAEREERSMQQVVKRMLIPALEAALTDAA